MDQNNPQETAAETTNEAQEPTILQSIAKNAIGLALFAFITAGVIAIVQLNTAETIEYNIAQAQAKALYEIVPKAAVDNDVLLDVLELTTEEAKSQLSIRMLGPIKEGSTAHLAKLNGELHTIIFPVIAPDGYTTAIQLLVGITLNGELAGVRIVEHKETPGLGDKIELKKSDWVLDFNGKSLNNPSEEKWTVKKDGGEFDQFTGATITPRSVVHAVKQALEFYQQHKTQILDLANKTTNKPTKEEA